ncbi:hypothetical protein GCM10010277_42310 [Streptomyces longisporoflavus]|nr:hypothetical protein GCM10010277_42310 [Streptomyces longisporoflavus]
MFGRRPLLRGAARKGRSRASAEAGRPTAAAAPAPTAPPKARREKADFSYDGDDGEDVDEGMAALL